MKPDAPFINARKALPTPLLALVPRKPRLAWGSVGERGQSQLGGRTCHRVERWRRRNPNVQRRVSTVLRG